MDFSKISDKDLVKKSLEEAAVFGELVKRYQEKLFLYVRRISSGSAEDCEDLLQEIFIKTWKNLNSYNDSFAFSTWIYRIAHNAVISDFRKKKLATVELHEELPSEFLETFQTDLDEKYSKKQIAIVLQKLNLEQREMLVLRFLEEKSYEEISDILKRPIGTVSVQISRAKSAFKALAVKEKINFDLS